MKFFLAQIILAARKGDAENWMNILFIVAIVIFYAVANIVKAKANKSKGEQEEERPGRKPGLEPSEGIRKGGKAVQRRPYEQVRRAPGQPAHRIAPPPQAPPARREVGRPRPAVQKLAAKTEQDLLLEDLEPQEIQKKSMPSPELRSGVEKLPKFIGEPIKGLEGKQIGIPVETVWARYLAELSLDYADPEKLRRAILHYEILGRPLSLRNPSDKLF